MLGFGIRMIIVIIVIAGSISYIADLLGRFIGRRRLTLFGLRPKYTAIAITVISGVLIAVTTFVAIVIISKDARTALFGLEELRKTLKDTKADLVVKSKEREALTKEIAKFKKEFIPLEKELNSSKEEIARLREVRNKLVEEVTVARKGQLLFRVGDTILTSIVEVKKDKVETERKLKEVLSATDAYMRRLYGIESKEPSEPIIFISLTDFNKALNTLTKYKKEVIVNITAQRNIIYGEKIPIQFTFRSNDLIFKKNEVIYMDIIDGKLSLPEIEQKLVELLSHVRSTAIDKGIQADVTGSVGTVSYTEISKTARDISLLNELADVNVIATKAIYAIGPIDIDFRVSFHEKLR